VTVDGAARAGVVDPVLGVLVFGRGADRVLVLALRLVPVTAVVPRGTAAALLVGVALAAGVVFLLGHG
jgi:hypothetical protein